MTPGRTLHRMGASLLLNSIKSTLSLLLIVAFVQNPVSLQAKAFDSSSANDLLEPSSQVIDAMPIPLLEGDVADKRAIEFDLFREQLRILQGERLKRSPKLRLALKKAGCDPKKGSDSLLLVVLADKARTEIPATQIAAINKALRIVRIQFMLKKHYPDGFTKPFDLEKSIKLFKQEERPKAGT